MNKLLSQIIDSFLNLLKEYIENTKLYTLMVVCICLSLFLFASPEKALSLLSITQTPEKLRVAKVMVPPWILLFGLVFVLVGNVRNFRSQQNLNQFKFAGKAIISLNDYYEIPGFDTPPFRVVLNKISNEIMPPPYLCIPESDFNNKETETATLSFSPPLSMYHGRGIKRLDTESHEEETFIMRKSQLSEIESSVFYFYISPDGEDERFFRCTVHHINPTKKEAEVDLFLKWPV